MTEKILHEEIPIPRVNELPFEEGQEWAKRGYAQARFQVDEQRAKEIKDEFPLRTAYYVEKQTFGLRRLTAPQKGQDKSSLETVLDLLKPFIDPVRSKTPRASARPPKAGWTSNGVDPAKGWGQFRRRFSKQLKQSFDTICLSNYETTMIEEEKDRINQLITKFIRPGVSARLDFVPHPETVEFFDHSPRLLAIRNKIWSFFTGKPHDLSVPKQPPGPDSPRQMDMHLDLQVRWK